MQAVDPASFLRHLVADVLLLPPGFNLVLLALGVAALVWGRHPTWRPGARTAWRVGLGLLGLNAVLLYALSAPIAARPLLRAVESFGPPPLAVDAPAQGVQAVVLLTGGLRWHAPEYGPGPAPGDASWIRLLYAERLAERWGVPLLISGGGPIAVDSGAETEARTMARFVQRVPPERVWVEDASINTAGAAVEVRRQYPALRRVALVSDATHLVRGVPIFERQGFEVLGAPTRFADVSARSALAFMPNAHTLGESRRALHTLWGWLAARWG